MFAAISRIRNSLNPPEAKTLPDSKPIRFGILGAAAIAPDGILRPAKSHPEVVVHGVAARSIDRATEFAKKHGIEKVFGGPNGYQDLIDCPEIDAIYNPLPNGLHYEWTIKALLAGKHVLLEKPSANITEECRQMFELAEKKGLVLLEAFHYRFHPAVHRVKAILESGELGSVKGTTVQLAVPRGFFKADDIRYDFSLGGGALMDMGCYTISATRYFAGAEPTSVVSAEHELHSPQIDRKTTVTFAFPNGITSTIMCDSGIPPSFGFVPQMPIVKAVVECEEGRVELVNFVAPHVYHSLTVTKTDGESRVEKVYKFPDFGEDWYSTYRLQLEAFVDKIKGRTPRTWITKEDSIKNIEAIESVYAKSGLGSRPKSNYIPPLD